MPGEPAKSTDDADRRGGVIVAWREREFRADTAGARGGRAKTGAALVTAAVCDELLENAEISEADAAALKQYLGRRALSVRLVRRRGPLTNTTVNVASIYVPAAASERVRAAYIKAVAAALRAASARGEAWVAAGDWQASPSPEWRLGGGDNKKHDDALAACFWPSDGDGEAGGQVGGHIPLGLDHAGGMFSHHSTASLASTSSAGPAGKAHRTIDHVFIDLATAHAWHVANAGLSFLGGHGAEFDGESLFDHRVLLVEKAEGTMAQLGLQRSVALRLRKEKARSDFRQVAASIEVDWHAPPFEEMARLETSLAMRAADATMRACGDVERVRSLPPDGPEQQLAHYRGLFEAIQATFLEEEDVAGAARLRRFFGATGTTGLYRSKMLAEARDRELRRAWRRPGVEIDWRQLRLVALRAARRAFERLQPQVAAKRRADRVDTRLGRLEPADAQTMAQSLISRQRELGQAKRGAAFSLNALKGPDGKLATDADGVHAIAHAHGVKQNGKSTCQLDMLGCWLAAFVPQGETLQLPNGKPWHLRDAIPFEVFLREMRRAASSKAAALHPFVVDHLQCLPDGHPVLATYYELMIRCMESGTYPAHYLELVAVCIPKTYGNLTEISALRDIWLINHGAKLAERCLLHTGLAPLGRRYLAVAAGGCKGRGVVEQAFALHAAISDALATKSSIFVLYVDLIKCFMSFSRDAGEMAAVWAGLPLEVAGALRALCDSLKHGTVTGRFETAFGSTEAFDILRGFLQGSLSAPEMCKCMMNTLAEALELKVVGYDSFTPDGGGSYLTQLIFVDDAVNSTATTEMMDRVALLWSCWCRITGCQMNVEKFKKTVFTGLEHVEAKGGELKPRATQHRIYICGLHEGDPAREVPRMGIHQWYKYGGIWTSLDGKHLRKMMPFLANAIRGKCIEATRGKTSRRLTIGHANACILGLSFFYGSVVGSTMEHVEEILGTAARSCISRRASVAGRQRDRTAPRFVLHAPATVREERANDPERSHALRAGQGSHVITGYALAHPYPAMMAACVMTFVNALAIPLETPAHTQAMDGLARVLWELGCREAPLEDGRGKGGFHIGEQLDALNQQDVIDRPVWALALMGGGWLRLVHHLPSSSSLHPSRWPGYPEGWVHLWYGWLWQLQLNDGTRRKHCRRLMRAGVVELANLCNEDGDGYLRSCDAADECPSLRWFDTLADFDELVAFLRAAGVEPVPGRRPWPATEVKRGVVATYAPPGFGEGRRALRSMKEAAKASGDGGRALASQLGLSDRPEWVPAEGAAASVDSSHLPNAPCPRGPHFDARTHDAATMQSARDGCAAALGASCSRAMVDEELPGADQLSIDGLSRREVHHYPRKEEAEQRRWKVLRTGGHHDEMRGRGSAWLAWARDAYSFDAGGWLLGDAGHPQVPRAVLFWLACEAKLRTVGRSPDAEECAFVFDRLLHLEATMPVTHFCASDGSRRFATEAEKKAGDDEPHVARVVVAHDGSELRTLGGRLDPRRQGFERHSYEAELAGFHDHLTSTEDTVTVIVTDCLSGAMAGGRWRSRTAADKANRYRAQELDTLSGLEQQHRAVVYLWVHSHVGITPNEAADAECDAMQLGDFSALDLAPTSFHLMRVRGLKRGVGRPVLEFFEARLMHSLDEASLHTLRPQQGTWPLLANVRKQRLMRETDIDVLEDARGNRVGLFGDRLHDSTPTFAASPAEAEARRASQPTKGSWEWFRQRCGCPCCQAQPAAASVHVCGVSSANGVVQSRWHMFTECSPDDEDIGVKRAEAAGWLARHVGGWGGFGTKQAEYALAALTGGARALDDAQRHAALRFFLGLPDKPLADKDLPPSEQKSEEQKLAGGYCSDLGDRRRRSQSATRGG